MDEHDDAVIELLERWADRTAASIPPHRLGPLVPMTLFHHPTVRRLVAASVLVLAVAAIIWNVTRPDGSAVRTGTPASPPAATAITTPSPSASRAGVQFGDGRAEPATWARARW